MAKQSARGSSVPPVPAPKAPAGRSLPATANGGRVSPAVARSRSGAAAAQGHGDSGGPPGGGQK